MLFGELANIWQNSPNGNPPLYNVALVILIVALPVCGLISLESFVLDWRSNHSVSKIQIANAIITLLIVIIWIIGIIFFYLVGQALNNFANSPY